MAIGALAKTLRRLFGGWQRERAFRRQAERCLSQSSPDNVGTIVQRTPAADDTNSQFDDILPELASSNGDSGSGESWFDPRRGNSLGAFVGFSSVVPTPGFSAAPAFDIIS